MKLNINFDIEVDTSDYQLIREDIEDYIKDNFKDTFIGSTSILYYENLNIDSLEED